MLLRPPATARVVLVRPGATEFDDQGRIKGSLDMPLSEHGRQQARLVAEELAGVRMRTIYTSPCQSAKETSQLLAQGREVKTKSLECLRNVDHGLWHGKLIEEVRRNQPRAYRLGQDSPDAFCAPRGEPIHEAKARVIKALKKIVRKGREEPVAIVVPDPLATVVESLLRGAELSDLWKSETDNGRWQLIESNLA